MIENEVSPELCSFIEKERWKYPFKLTPNIEIEKDLKVTGDDAIEFIIDFGKEFDVDVSQFKAADYFEGEGIDIIGWIANLFKKRSHTKKILTLGNLEKAIKNKQLL
jgi:acyl carrier protein